jgi:hypothetical protein
MKMTTEESLRFYEAYNFIDMHPAFCGPMFRDGIRSVEMRVFKACKNDIDDLSPIFVYEEHIRFKDFLNRGFTESKVDDKVYEVWVPYEEYYGYEWEFDHVEVRLCGGAWRYINFHGEWVWQQSGLIEVVGSFYEEAFIKFADKAKEVYGDWSKSEFDDNTVVPKWIQEHNKIHRPFDFSKPFTDGKFERNEENISMNIEELNSLWWERTDAKDLFEGMEKVDISHLTEKPNG